MGKSSGSLNLTFTFIPNPDIESQFRAQVIDVHKEFAKTKYTSLVIKLFEGFLGALRTCVIIVISISGFGFIFN